MSTELPAVLYDAARKVYYNAEDGRVIVPECIQMMKFGKRTQPVAVHPLRYVEEAEAPDAA